LAAELIQINNVSKSFVVRHNRNSSLKSSFIGLFHQRYRERRETLWALREISFTIMSGETLGLVGRNGSGKSTLLRIIAGIYQPTSGTIQVNPSLSVGAMIELGVGFHPELTGKENVFLGASIHGLSRKEVEEVYPSVVEFAELDGFMDLPIKNYSSGMHARLGFALAVSLQPDVLLVDEILSVGDEAFQKKCMETMKKIQVAGKTVVFVSHSSETTKNFCDRVCLLDQGLLKALGTADDVLREYHELLGLGTAE
jgi:ABC-type polysaccharide/polyol phosphate transport system ATPase subunit